MPKSVELFKELEEDEDVEMEDTKPTSAAPSGTIRIPLPSINPTPTNTQIDFMDQVNSIQSKYNKPTPKPTKPSPTAPIPTRPSKPTSEPTSEPTRTPKPTILINEEMIESFDMPASSSIFQGVHRNLLKVLFLGLLFYVLGNKKTTKFTNSLNISTRVDSLVIHTILFALITYIVLVI
jgi:hypothetical protein